MGMGCHCENATPIHILLIPHSIPILSNSSIPIRMGIPWQPVDSHSLYCVSGDDEYHTFRRDGDRAEEVSDAATSDPRHVTAASQVELLWSTQQPAGDA